MSAKPNMSASTESAARAVHPLRPISFGTPAVTVDRRDDGTIYLRPKAQLLDYPVRLTDRLHHWVEAAPDRVFMAERNAARGWRQITYAELLASSRHIASALLARGLSVEKPVVILSGNSIDHVLIAFGALYAGIPFCPVSPAYSLVSRDYGKLSFLMKLLTPGLVFTDDASKFADALSANVTTGTEIAASRGAVAGRPVTMLSDLLATPEHPGLDAAHEAIGPLEGHGVEGRIHRLDDHGRRDRRTDRRGRLLTQRRGIGLRVQRRGWRYLALGDFRPDRRGVLHFHLVAHVDLREVPDIRAREDGGGSAGTTKRQEAVVRVDRFNRRGNFLHFLFQERLLGRAAERDQDAHDCETDRTFHFQLPFAARA